MRVFTHNGGLQIVTDLEHVFCGDAERRSRPGIFTHHEKRFIILALRICQAFITSFFRFRHQIVIGAVGPGGGDRHGRTDQHQPPAGQIHCRGRQHLADTGHAPGLPVKEKGDVSTDLDGGFFQLFRPEVRPEHWAEVKFRIGALEKQKIAEPLLAACAYDKVGVGQGRVVEQGAEGFFREFFRAQTFEQAVGLLKVVFSGAAGAVSAGIPWLMLGMAAAVWIYQLVFDSRFNKVLAWAPLRYIIFAIVVALILIVPADANQKFLYFDF